MAPRTLNKQERLCGLRLTEQLFDRAGSRSVASFPIRAVWRETERHEGEPPVKVLMSVSKRHFKRAVKRNRVKRQLREAYRLNKQIIVEAVEQQQGRALMVGFVWLADELFPSEVVAEKINKLLNRIAEKL